MKTSALLVLGLLLANSSAAQNSQLFIGPNTLPFGNVQVGSYTEVAFAIQHLQNSDPASGTVAIDNTGAFRIISGTPFSLSGSQGTNVVIRFTPNAVSTYNGVATVSSLAIFSGGNTVNLSGSGIIVPGQGAVHVNATLDGVAWTGNLDYSLTGPATFIGNTVPADFQQRPIGSYVFAVGNGGPSKSFLRDVTPGNVQTLADSSTVTYTVNFTSTPKIVTSLAVTPSKTINLSFPTMIGFNYPLEFTESLTTPAWVKIGERLGDGSTATFNQAFTASAGYCRLTVEYSRGFLSFPLGGLTPYSAQISAVFDHSEPNNCSNGVVTAYTNEKGLVDFGRFGSPTATGSLQDCPNHKLYGFPKDVNRATKFLVTGSYTGGAGGPYYLFYDGHTGYDYPMPNGTDVLAAADGTAYEGDYGGNNGGKDVRIDHANGYSTYYLHLQDNSVGAGPTAVTRGSVIGHVGQDHLHLTVKKGTQRADPYGWLGPAGSDPCPVDGQDNQKLWLGIR